MARSTSFSDAPSRTRIMPAPAWSVAKATSLSPRPSCASRMGTLTFVRPRLISKKPTNRGSLAVTMARKLRPRCSLGKGTSGNWVARVEQRERGKRGARGGCVKRGARAVDGGSVLQRGEPVRHDAAVVAVDLKHDREGDRSFARGQDDDEDGEDLSRDAAGDEVLERDEVEGRGVE